MHSPKRNLQYHNQHWLALWLSPLRLMQQTMIPRTYIDNPVTALDWDHMDKAGTVDGNYVNYSGFVYYNNTNGDFDQSFNGDTVNGTISTYYLNHDYADSTANQLDISNSVIHGSITSMLPGGYYDRFDADGNNLGGYDFYTDAVVDTHWRDGDVFTLNIANTTIDDDYEALYFTDSYKDGDVTKHTNETFDTSEGVAVNLDVESNINISNNSALQVLHYLKVILTTKPTLPNLILGITISL